MSSDAVSGWKLVLDLIVGLMVAGSAGAIHRILERRQRLEDALEEQKAREREQELEERKRLEERMLQLETDKSYERGFIEGLEEGRNRRS